MSTRSRTGHIALALAVALLGVLALIGVVIVVTIGTLGSGQGCGGQAPAGSATIALGPPGSGQLVGATEYGGPGDPSSGTVGSSGANLVADPDSYAELGGTTFATATAMGGLPYMTPLRITWGSRSAIAYKRDIGLGGGPIEGLPRVIDLWWQLAGSLGIPYEDGLWSGPVKVARPPASGAANLLGGDPLAAAAPAPTAAAAPAAPATALAAPAAADGACAAPAAGGVSLTPGPRAQLLPDGQASAPADAPAAVKGMIAAGNQIIGKPYYYGGGHGIPLDEIASTYDCSSSVAHLLYGGGLLPVSADVDSTELESFGDPGPGRWVTIYASAGHVFMYVAGLRWDTHNAAGPGDGSTGIGWHPLVRSDAGFVARHPSGL